MNLLVKNKKFEAACKEVHEWADTYVAKTLAAREVQKDEEKEVEGGRKKYIVLNEIADELQDPRQLRDEMLNLLLAGRDTTAGLLSNSFHALARHPRIWEKLRAEVESTLEGRLPTYDDLKNMKYLKAIMNECKTITPNPRSVLCRFNTLYQPFVFFLPSQLTPASPNATLVSPPAAAQTANLQSTSQKATLSSTPSTLCTAAKASTVPTPKNSTPSVGQLMLQADHYVQPGTSSLSTAGLESAWASNMH